MRKKRWLFTGFFLLIVAGGMSAADWSGLEHMDWAMAPQTIPIMILALVYHDLTPGITYYALASRLLVLKLSCFILTTCIPLHMEIVTLSIQAELFAQLAMMVFCYKLRC
jgi:tyrosine-specific transport protein